MDSLGDFEYELEPEAIAQTPSEPRDSARLLDAIGGTVDHRQVHDLPDLIEPGDVIVVNDTRVIPARLSLFKPTGGACEVFLLSPDPSTVPSSHASCWRALVRGSRRVAPGTELVDSDGASAIEVSDDLGDGLRLVGAIGDESILEIAHRLGEVPLPPYINRSLDDAERYQTVYARNELSVAAPTAGLHLTPAVLDTCRQRGATVHTVELAVGLGTFRPIVVDDLADHEMHAERFVVAPEVLDACRDGERVIAIGTTTVRALESSATLGTADGSTELFIRPGYRWKLVDVVLTNFHQPRSSLLVMLAAFAGPRWRDIYHEALAAQYRFLSFGDAMIVDRARRHSESGNDVRV